MTPEEVKKALNQMHAYKSLGPNGFLGFLFKQYWNIFGNDVSSMVIQAFETGSLIDLISKIDCPCTFKDFRPVTFVTLFIN